MNSSNWGGVLGTDVRQDGRACYWQGLRYVDSIDVFNGYEF